MKLTGKVQHNWKRSEEKRERYQVYTFKGLWSFFREMYRGYRSGCDKIYIFFDKPVVK